MADMKGISARTAATVVRSSMVMAVEVFRDPQGPTAVISARAGLFVLAPERPPVAAKYTRVPAEGQV